MKHRYVVAVASLAALLLLWRCSDEVSLPAPNGPAEVTKTQPGAPQSVPIRVGGREPVEVQPAPATPLSEDGPGRVVGAVFRSVNQRQNGRR